MQVKRYRVLPTGAQDQQAGKTGIPLLPPIYQNSTFRFETAAECASAFIDEESGYVYTRWGNPTQKVLEQKLAVLEIGEAALATASGMGAISTALLTALADGGHVIAMETLYSATYNLLNEEFPVWELRQHLWMQPIQTKLKTQFVLTQRLSTSKVQPIHYLNLLTLLLALKSQRHTISPQSLIIRLQRLAVSNRLRLALT